jgi:hypothetical protein
MSSRLGVEQSSYRARRLLLCPAYATIALLLFLAAPGRARSDSARPRSVTPHPRGPDVVRTRDPHPALATRPVLVSLVVNLTIFTVGR